MSAEQHPTSQPDALSVWRRIGAETEAINRAAVVGDWSIVEELLARRDLRFGELEWAQGDTASLDWMRRHLESLVALERETREAVVAAHRNLARELSALRKRRDALSAYSDARA